MIHNSVHTGAFNHRLKSHKHAVTRVPDAHEAFHVDVSVCGHDGFRGTLGWETTETLHRHSLQVYGIEWTEGAITYFIDDTKTFEFKNTKTGDSDEWAAIFQSPYFLRRFRRQNSSQFRRARWRFYVRT